MVWILRDLEHMDEITRDYAVGVTDPDRRRLLLLPWRPVDLADYFVSPQPKPVSENFFRAARKNETLPSENVGDPVLPTDRKIRVYAEYGNQWTQMNGNE